MSTRSTVLDLFGEFVRYTGGSLGLSPLSEVLEPLGVQPDTSRAVMTRLRAKGWFTSARDGRQVTYRISPHLYSVLDEGRERIYRVPGGPWDGSWHTVIYTVPEEHRALRETIRKRLTYLGFGSPAPSTWLSAHDLRARVELLMLDLGIEDTTEIRLIQMLSQTGSVAIDRQIARRCWDLEGINEAYLDWMRRWRPRVQEFVADPPSGGAALAATIALVGEYRRFPIADPALPTDLLPTPWHGKNAFTLFMTGYHAVRPAADAHFERVTGQPIDRSGMPAAALDPTVASSSSGSREVPSEPPLPLSR